MRFMQSCCDWGHAHRRAPGGGQAGSFSCWINPRRSLFSASLMKKLLLPLALFSFAIFCRAETQAPIPLWPDGATGAFGKEDKDIPTITPFLPEPGAGTGAAIVICPGGAYAMLAEHEGGDYALWLNQHGITGFVLKYRLGSHGYHHPAMLPDAAPALRLVAPPPPALNVEPPPAGLI